MAIYHLSTVHCMNISCVSCVHDMIRTHYFAHVVWRVGTRYVDVRLVFGRISGSCSEIDSPQQQGK